MYTHYSYGLTHFTVSLATATTFYIYIIIFIIIFIIIIIRRLRRPDPRCDVDTAQPAADITAGRI